MPIDIYNYLLEILIDHNIVFAYADKDLNNIKNIYKNKRDRLINYPNPQAHIIIYIYDYNKNTYIEYYDNRNENS